MKTFTKTLMMALMAMLAFSVTSCDDDDEIAYTLEGTWEGDMYVTTYYDGVNYDATRTEVCFLRDPYRYSSGDGYWVDYYRDYYWGGYNYIANHIRWEVYNRRITIHLIEEDYTFDIYDYSLTDNYFTGYLYFDDVRHKFNLRHVSSPNWNSYYYGYYDDYYDPYYYSNGNSLGMQRAKANKPEAPKRVFRTRE